MSYSGTEGGSTSPLLTDSPPERATWAPRRPLERFRSFLRNSTAGSEGRMDHSHILPRIAPPVKEPHPTVEPAGSSTTEVLLACRRVRKASQHLVFHVEPSVREPTFGTYAPASRSLHGSRAPSFHVERSPHSSRLVT